MGIFSGKKSAGEKAILEGAVDRCDESGISGWARFTDRPDTVLLDLYLEDALVATVKCNRMREDLTGMRKDGRFAFQAPIHPQTLNALPSTTRLRLEESATKDVFFESTIKGKGQTAFDGNNDRGQKLTLNKNGRLTVLLGDRDAEYIERLLTFAQQVIDEVDSEPGCRAFITYGTLLGAARSSTVIPHDDDVDLTVFVESDGPGQVERRVDRLTRRLSKAGLGINKLSVTQFHVVSQDLWIDVFVSWSIGDRYYMRWGINGEFRVQDVFPFSTIELHGRMFSAPRNLGQFLSVLYGENWIEPDPWFNWNERDVWGKLPEAYRYLGDSLLKTTQYWDQFYRRADTIPSWPSQFACFVLDEVNSKCASKPTIVDVGCGNGRDTAFFANQGYRVIGLDGSKTAIEFNRQRELENAQFVPCNFNDIGSVERACELISREQQVILYSRFFVHAIDDHAEDLLVEFCGQLRGPVVLVAFEFRIPGDESRSKVTAQHFRRFRDQAALVEKMTRAGYALEYSVEGTGLAKYRDDDALVCRLLFCPNGPKL